MYATKTIVRPRDPIQRNIDRGGLVVKIVVSVKKHSAIQVKWCVKIHRSSKTSYFF